MLVVRIAGDGVHRFSQLSQQLGDGRARNVYSRAINDEGAKAATHTGRALAKQTGLKAGVTREALKKRDRSTPATLAFVIKVQGGNIRVKYFNPRENDAGVSANPWNKRVTYSGAFMRAGFWPNRVDKDNWNGQVFYRTGIRKFTKKYPKGNAKFPNGMDQFKVARSGVFIPIEATQGQTAATFNKSGSALETRVTHYLKRLSQGAIS